MDEQLLARLNSMDSRMGNIESSLKIINHEMGVLCGKIKNGGRNGNVTPVSPTVALVVKYIAFPLIIITGALVGVKLNF